MRRPGKQYGWNLGLRSLRILGSYIFNVFSGLIKCLRDRLNVISLILSSPKRWAMPLLCFIQCNMLPDQNNKTDSRK